MEDTLTPEQIQNWRRIIYMQIEDRYPGAGAYAIIMPEAEVIEYWKKMKAVLESPETLETIKKEEIKENYSKPYQKPKCKHTNSITGSRGTYCLDCEEYV